MKQSLVVMTVMVIASILLMSLWNVQAAGKPIVVSHDETYANKAVRFRVVWHAENPVCIVRIFAGKDHKEFKIEEYDNRRTRDGYSGELNTVVELDPSFMEESLAYVIQVEDDVRLKSDPVNGKIQIPRTGLAGAPYPGMMPQPIGGGMPQPMMGGFQQNIGGMSQPPPGGMITPPPGGMMQQPMGGTMPPTGQPAAGSTVGIINQVAGIVASMDLPPNLDNIVITKIGVNGVHIGTRANDDKGLTGIAFRIFDYLGNLVQQNTAATTGKVWEGSATFSNLASGNYRVVVQATDNAGNTSPEKTESFSLTGAAAVTPGSSLSVDGSTMQPSTNTPVDTTTVTTQQGSQ